MRRTLFLGSSSTKALHHSGHPEMKARITPSILLEDRLTDRNTSETRMGILLYCTPTKVLREEDGTCLEPFEIFNGHAAWIDPVRWWRALQLIEAMPCITSRVFRLNLFLAAGRYERDDLHYQEIVAIVRQAMTDPSLYEEIMARPVPTNVVALTIQLADEGLQNLNLLHLSDEIERGTICWSRELKRIGVQHPNYRRAVAAQKNAIVAKYEPYLSSYRIFRVRHGTKALFDIEWAIYNSIERGLEEYGADVTALLSILHAEIRYDDLMEEVAREFSDARNPYVRPPKEQRFDETITWFLKSFTEEPLSGRPITESYHDCREQLQRLHRDWEQLPITHPLVGVSDYNFSPFEAFE
ncbi:MAG: hypothetical protein H0U76_14945 [Ktedonobacteraceae bacterium]|nr:hypothetical protein [Ktedonobacteraceae bacterium]